MPDGARPRGARQAPRIAHRVRLVAAGALVAPLSPSWSGRPAEAREVLVRFQGVGRWSADRSLVPRRSATRWPPTTNRPLPPSRRVEVTGPCATRAPAGSTPVACSARSIWSARMRAGRTVVRARVTRREHRIFATAWMRPRHRGPPGRDDGSRHPMRARARCALKARRASSDAYTNRRSLPLFPGLRVQERSARSSPRTG